MFSSKLPLSIDTWGVFHFHQLLQNVLMNVQTERSFYSGVSKFFLASVIPLNEQKCKMGSLSDKGCALIAAIISMVIQHSQYFISI